GDHGSLARAHLPQRDVRALDGLARHAVGQVLPAPGPRRPGWVWGIPGDGTPAGMPHTFCGQEYCSANGASCPKAPGSVERTAAAAVTNVRTACCHWRLKRD